MLTPYESALVALRKQIERHGADPCELDARVVRALGLVHALRAANLDDQPMSEKVVRFLLDCVAHELEVASMHTETLRLDADGVP